jgi:hypothetical protein
MVENKSVNNIKSLVFLEGFMVLALQIIVSVIVTPYWGNSFVFWSLSLFFTMLALSFGYFLAPFILRKTKNNATSLLVKLLWAFYIYLIFIFIQADNLLLRLISDYSSLITGNVITLFFFIFIPVMCLAMVPVLVINHRSNTQTEDEGTVTGKVFSLSSLSGITAVLLLSFVTIPIWGILATKIILLSIVFLLFFLFLRGLKKKSSSYILMGVFVLSLVMLNQPKKIASESSNVRLIEQIDGLLGQIKVVDYPYEKTRFFYVNNASQSKVHATGRSLFPYVYSISIYSSYKPVGSDVLIAGMGGGSLVYELSNFGYNIDVVDIDSRLEGVVQRHGLVPAKKANFIESDIRRYVNNSQKKYDVIILDLSKGEIVPTNVYTVESFAKCKGMLKKDGILLVHFLSSLTENGQLALASVGKTLREAGFDYRLMNILNKTSLMDGAKDLSKPDGYIFCAAQKIDFTNTKFIIDPSIIEELVPKKENLFLEFNDDKGLLLTDDKPILDVLQMENAAIMRKINIESIIATEGYGK